MADSYKIVLSPKAKRDISQILRYVRSISDLQATVKVHQLLLESFEKIARMPTRSSVFHTVEENEIRSFEAKKRYRILYAIEEKAQQVAVIRVAHVKMNKPTLLAFLEEE